MTTPPPPWPGSAQEPHSDVPTTAAAELASEMARWRDAVLEVQAVLLSGTDGDVLLHAVADAARRLAAADVATVAVPRVEGVSLVLRAAVGYRADDLRGSVFPMEESLSGQVLKLGQALHLADVTAHANAYQPVCELGDLGPTLLLPLTCGARNYGTLLVSRRRGEAPFTDQEFELLCLFAGHVSVAVEFCRSQEELQRLARVEDSERVGRELHDTVLQRLFGIGMQLQALSSRSDERAGQSLQPVLDELDETVREIRAKVLEPRES
jgi:signal transduction histidine kinase